MTDSFDITAGLPTARERFAQLTAVSEQVKQLWIKTMLKAEANSDRGSQRGMWIKLENPVRFIKTVLCVHLEDADDAREVADRLFASRGYEVSILNTPESAPQAHVRIMCHADSKVPVKETSLAEEGAAGEPNAKRARQ